ncbi:uncharacterized protein Z518_02271 [Rhinocladiella mackenziei CBS 650.93]|uniref:Uncharacterized protein n=1 Tax=Rhinocladiella mackenziei CBS 650.93 TaxID=1442369 RepID=A0A0D2HAZ8_9EURO|nr:uncharacterized protein Z518_02271 [Rhinocladiella mackenziei CBS 650.93]KIX07618.1 hypothetical protein Z518_02271 [Rhinocladiella mackenziei CBS 650.93]
MLEEKWMLNREEDEMSLWLERQVAIRELRAYHKYRRNSYGRKVELLSTGQALGQGPSFSLEPNCPSRKESSSGETDRGRVPKAPKDPLHRKLSDCATPNHRDGRDGYSCQVPLRASGCTSFPAYGLHTPTRGLWTDLIRLIARLQVATPSVLSLSGDVAVAWAEPSIDLILLEDAANSEASQDGALDACSTRLIPAEPWEMRQCA